MDKQQIIAKYGKKFASTNDATPVLTGVHYAADGSVFITDRHYALRIRNAHTLETPITLHPKTGMPIEGIYPDVGKIFPTQFDNEIQIVGDALNDALLCTRCATDIAIRLNKKHPIVALSASNGLVYLEIKDADKKLEFSAFFGNTVKIDASKRSLNAEYLHTGLSVFDDAGYDATVKFKEDPFSPIVLTNNDDIDVLILPYRTTQPE